MYPCLEAAFPRCIIVFYLTPCIMIQVAFSFTQMCLQLRTVNDGLQPWYGDRKTFGLRSVRSYEFKKSEEGLAALNTILQAKVKYLYGPALGYCKLTIICISYAV